jgi:hypothetical protein
VSGWQAVSAAPPRVGRRRARARSARLAARSIVPMAQTARHGARRVEAQLAVARSRRMIRAAGITPKGRPRAISVLVVLEPFAAPIPAARQMTSFARRRQYGVRFRSGRAAAMAGVEPAEVGCSPCRVHEQGCSRTSRVRHHCAQSAAPGAAVPDARDRPADLRRGFAAGFLGLPRPIFTASSRRCCE